MRQLFLTVTVAALITVSSLGQKTDADSPVSWSSTHIQSIAFSPHGDLVACANLNGMVTLRNASSGTLKSTLKLPLRKHDAFGNVFRVAFSPDGKLLAAGGSRSFGQMSRALTAIWDVRSGKLIRELEGTGYAGSVAFAPDGRRIAVAEGHTRSLQGWDIQSGKVARSLSAPRNEMVSVACSPDGRFIVGGTASLDVHTEGDIIVWDARTGRQRWSRNLQGAYVLKLAFSKTGDRIFAGLLRWNHPSDGASQPLSEVDVWDTATGKTGLRWTGGRESVSGLCLSPDGRLLAYCGFDQSKPNSGAFAIIDSATLKTKRMEQTEAVIDVAFSPDGKRLAVATENQVKILSVASLIVSK